MSSTLQDSFCPSSYSKAAQQAHPLLPSMNKLRYDANAYSSDLAQSRSAGGYYLETPMPHCQPCFANDPRMQMGYSGHSECRDRALIDTNSDILGITRKASSAPGCKYQAPRNPNEYCSLVHVPDCTTKVLAVQDTRLTNPPSTLRATGWNRWEWLCANPQDHAILNFETGVDTSIVTKDNHRPRVVVPEDQTAVLPPRKYETADKSAPKWMPKECAEPEGFITQMPNMHWRSCQELDRIQNGCRS
jgi:hypothetical protein